jgi:predicted Zn-ribbon and HTH transcriptional regulator
VGKKSKKPAIPKERQETIRQQIHSILGGQALSAKEISAHISVSEKEVYEHLDHIQKTVNKSGFTLIITPAECRKCGFVFRKREKMKKPGKCPICRGESIKEPLFSIE